VKHFCREASRLVSDAGERDLTLAERFRLRLHLMMCNPCSNHVANLGVLERVFAAMRRQADESAPCLTEQDRQRIRQYLQERIESDPAAGA